MKQQDKDILCGLIRDHEDLVGSSRAAMLALQAFITSIRQLKCPADQIREQYMELSEAIKDTRPKIIPLIHLVEEFEQQMEQHFGNDLEAIREKAVLLLQAQHDKLKDKVGKIIERGMDCIQDDDVIVVHTASSDVANMITMSKQVLDRKIKVIVLKQDFVKTRQLINAFTAADIDLETVPEFSLSHFIEKANKMFMGTLSVTHDMKAVTAVGTANVASLCHFQKIPVYLFANTLKFSHRASQDQLIHRKQISEDQDACRYMLTTYSHDMVDLELVDFLVTEEGVYPKGDIAAYVKKICR